MKIKQKNQIAIKTLKANTLIKTLFVELLADLNEELAVKNKQRKKIIKIVKIVLIVIVVLMSIPILYSLFLDVYSSYNVIIFFKNTDI